MTISDEAIYAAITASGVGERGFEKLLREMFGRPMHVTLIPQAQRQEVLDRLKERTKVVNRRRIDSGKIAEAERELEPKDVTDRFLNNLWKKDGE